MRRPRSIQPVWSWRYLACSLVFGIAVPAFSALTLQSTTPLPAIKGRIDHFAHDEAGQRLFVAALGNDSVEVIDLRTGRATGSIPGLAEPQGVCFVPENGRLYVANGGDGSVRVFDGKTLALIAAIPFGNDADNLRYDGAARRLYVGYGSGAIGAIDVMNNHRVADIALPSHPESFQLERSALRIFVNLPGAHEVAVIDRRQGIVTAKWSIGLATANYPMALDETSHRLWVACRLPARLLLFDTQTGGVIAKLDLHGDCDDVFFDAVHGRVYASCGEGFVDVFAPTGTGSYERLESIPTEKGARTCFLANERLWVAVPRHGDRAAEVRCYLVSGSAP